MVEESCREIEEANRRFGEVVRSGDASAVGSLYTEDALLMPPTTETILGREGTTKFWDGAIKMGLKDVILSTVELHHEADVVEEVANYTLKIHPQGQPPFEDIGKHVVLWKQGADGAWRLQRDIWNSNLPERK